MRPFRVGTILVFGGVFTFGCAQHLASTTRAPAEPALEKPAPGASIAQPASPTRPVHKPRPAFPERKPELGITTPMKGDPAPAALAESRLQATTCEQAAADDIEPLLREMREAVNESQKEWVAEQPACWQQMREDYRQRKQWEKSASDPFGSGGLGLSGVGEGGGGRGEGIGLGSVGTLGHGAGVAAAPAMRSADPGSARGNMWGSGGEDKKKGDSEPAEAKKKSGTNNQVATVDEADIVKTDGKWVYVVASGALRIMEALEPHVVSTTKLPGTPREMFVEGDRAVVYTSSGNTGKKCTYAYDCEFAGDGTSTKVQVFSLADRAHPALLRTIDLSGSLIAARRIGNAIHTVVSDGDAPAPSYETWPADLETCGTPDAVAKAKFAKLKRDNEVAIRASHRSGAFPTLRENGKEQKLCGGLLRTAIRDGKAFTSVVSFDMTDDKATPTTQTIESRPGAVFASDKSLYVSVVHRKNGANRWYSYYANSNEVSDIHKFRIGASPNDTKYVGSGSVPGHVLNQFAMDEWYGYLRVATSKGRVPDPKVESTISILSEAPGGNLARIGAVDHIAPGEDIRAVRFDDDRGYIVTFKKTDPLFVIDMYKPTQPQILGELKIPGFSTYLHRIDPEHLMSIGFDADDQGSFAYFNGIILQLFDVKDATNPKLVHKEKIGTRGSSSEAATNHLAFNWMPSEGLLALPMTICEGGGNGRFGNELAFSGLLVYDVDLERGFTRLGGVDHGTKGVSCQTWWTNANSAVKRSVFLDDLVYSIAEDRVKVQNLNRLGTDVADMSFVGDERRAASE
ncbi:MAG: beta-propeller domain-containing protein [Labilithrix sp.]